MTDHYPTKKRKYCPNSKTPKRNLRSDCKQKEGYTPPLAKDIPLPRKSLKIISPTLASSDESCIEIGWDNNSPSPSTILKSSKGRRNRKEDISSLLKNFPKKRRCHVDKDSHDDEILLSTWMQEDLAAGSSDAKARQSNRRLNLRRTLRQRGTVNFNKELRKFAELAKSAEKQDIVGNIKTLIKPSFKKEKRSPLIDKSLSDSILGMGNFDELLIDDTSSGSSGKRNSPCVITAVVKTPKLCKRNQKREEKTVKRECINTIKTTEVNLTRNSLPGNSREKKWNLRNSTLPAVQDKTTKSIVPLPFNDELDDILSTQMDLDDFTHALDSGRSDSKSALNINEDIIDLTQGNGESNEGYTKLENNNKEGFDINKNNIAEKRKIMSTPKPANCKAVTNEDLMFDSILLNFDDDFDIDDEFKCKSQETPPPPPSVTSDQRKLKTRSHTSPFPLRKNMRYDKCKNVGKSSARLPVVDKTLQENKQTHLTSAKSTVKGTQTARLNLGITRNTCPRPGLTRNSRHTLNSNKSVKTTINKPILTHNSNTPRLALDLSRICDENKRGNVCEVEDSMISPCITETGKEMPLSSTQKCNYSEIERKRQEALLKLKARTRLKK